MRLIFITRKVDKGDPLTGFVFGWIEKLATRLEKLYVICQEQGDISGLPSNIELYSFGKEKGYGRFRQAYKLLAISYKLSPKSEGFFVHMHPIYAILAWLPAKLFGKKMALWYTHKSVDLKLKIAHALVDTVFTASKESFRLPSGKARIVGHGIDLKKFVPKHVILTLNEVKGKDLDSSASPQNDKKFRILSIGRISPVKDYETLIKAVEILVNHKDVKDLKVQIYGKAGLPEHQAYLDSLIKFVENAELDEYIDFQGELSYDYVDEVYQEADLFVNLSQTGSIDKAVLEAAATGILLTTSNEAFREPLSKISPLLVFAQNQPQALAETILKLKNLSVSSRQALGRRLRAWVEAEHNLDKLILKIVSDFRGM